MLLVEVGKKCQHEKGIPRMKMSFERAQLNKVLYVSRTMKALLNLALLLNSAQSMKIKRKFLKVILIFIKIS